MKLEFPQARLSHAFEKDAPTLLWMPKKTGFMGAYYIANGQKFTRGRGYAFVRFAETDSPEAVYDLIEERARALGRELERHLRGEGENRLYPDILERHLRGEGENRLYPDIQAAAGIGVSHIRKAEPGDMFFHLAGLPHLADDDGDGIRIANITEPKVYEVRIRFWGQAVPQGGIP